MRKIVNRNFFFIPSRAYFFQARWSSVLLFISLRILIASFQSWVAQKHFFLSGFSFEGGPNRHGTWVMWLCLCSRASKDRKTSRTGRRRNKKVRERRLNCCSNSFYLLEIQLYFSVSSGIWTCLTWVRFPPPAGGSAGSFPEHSNRYDLLVLLVCTWRQGVVVRNKAFLSSGTKLHFF